MAILCWIIPGTAQPEETDHPVVRQRIVFIAPQNQADAVRPILETIDAELVDISVDIYVETVDEIPALPEQQILVGSRILEESGGILVFWYGGEAHNNIVFIYRTKRGNRMITRELAGSGKEGVWDAMGMMVGGTVRYLVEENAIEIPESKPAPRPERVKKPKRARAEKEEPKPPAAERWRLAGQAGYVGQMVSAERDFTHGGRLLLVLQKAWFAILGGAEAATPVLEKTSGIQLKQQRFPFYLGLGVRLPFSRWQLGATGNLGLSVAKLTPRTSNEKVVVIAPSYRLIITVELLISAQVRIWKAVSFWTGAGVEIFLQKRVYRVVDGPALFEKHGRFQPKWLVGGVVHFR